MANKISYFVPAPPKATTGKRKAKLVPKYKKIKFHFKETQKFTNQFVAASPPTSALPLPPLAVTMLAAAINCGYGSTPGEMLTPLNFPWWLDLQKYLKARLDLLINLLDEVSTPPYVCCTPFMPLVETTETGDMSTLLGMILCRVATESWASTFCNGSRIVRFWHWKVAKDAATCMDSQVRPGIRDVNNPDFIFEIQDGWYTTEAKGTFGSEKWSHLRDGLEQARKFDSIVFNDLTANAIVQAPVKGFSCTMAYFDETTSELQVTHLDPPAQVKKSSNSLKIVKEFSDLVCFERALSQFDTLSENGSPRTKLAKHLPDINWRLIRHGSKATEPVYLGMPKAIIELEYVLHLILTALRIIVPLAAVLEDKETRSHSRVADASSGCLRALMEKAENTDGPEKILWSTLHRTVSKFLKIERAGGHRLLAFLARRRIFPQSGKEKFKILELHNQLLMIAKISQNYVHLKTELTDQNNPKNRIDVIPTDYGLLLIRGHWSVAAAEAVRRLKI